MTKRVPSQLELDFVFDTEFVSDRSLAALGVFIADLSHYVAWEAGMAYTGHSISVEASGCRLILKANKGALPKVTFLYAETILGLYRELWLCLHKDMLRWSDDKFA